MGPPAARAERMVGLCLRRARRQRTAAHEHSRSARHRDPGAMRGPRARGGSRGSAAARGGTRMTAHSFRARQWVLFALLLAAAAGLMGRAVNLQLVDHGFLAS